MKQTLYQPLLDYWFADALEGAEQAGRRNAFWFQASRSTDSDIKRRFGKMVSAARAGTFDDWRTTPKGSLALIILLDQFPRNIYRGSAKAFASDDRALAVTLVLLEGQIVELHPIEQSIALLPLEHCEQLPIQRQSVAQFGRLLSGHRDSQWSTLLQTALTFAEQHLDIIQQFGRFPYRNEVLGRESTEAEICWLQTAQRFGQ